MKNIVKRVKNKKLMIGFLTCVFVLLSAFSFLLKPNKVNIVHATEITTDTTYNVPVTKIDGWRAFRDMEIYGQNSDNGCGMTAMAIALRFRPNAKTLSLISVGLY